MTQVRRYFGFGLAALAVIGLLVLGDALNPWVPVGVVVFGVIATIPILARGFLSLLCAAVVAMLVLVAFNVVVGVLIDLVPDAWVSPTYRLPIWAGLLLAVLVFGWASYYYVRATWLRQVAGDRATRVLAPAWRRSIAAVSAVGLTCVVILGVPPFVAWLQDRGKPPPKALPAPERLGSRLDVIIISDRVRTDASGGGGPPPAAEALDVRFSVGQGRGRRVLWTRTGIEQADVGGALGAPGREGRKPPALRTRANAVIVLLVDAVKDCTRQLARWEAIASVAQEAVGAPIPVVSLLPTTDTASVTCWKQSKSLVAVEQLGARAVTDAAVAMSTVASTAQRYLDVALEHRPILLFDRDEPVPRPLSIEQMFEAQRVRQCPDLGDKGTCETTPVSRPEDLESPGMHLVIDRPRTDLKKRARDELAAWGNGESTIGSADNDRLAYGSRIYVNPVPVKSGNRQLLYLDYWWYLPDNPTGAGKRAFCGAGLVIVGVTCFDHESDWEGVTVVLERSADGWKPLAVHYAQHEAVVRYPWAQLRVHWDAAERLTDDVTRMQNRAERPLVYVASGTHASYAHRCGNGCKQVAKPLEEGDHAGAIPWVGNDDDICLAVSCLALLPTTTGGRGPASWNAFAGPWGRRHCQLKYYCDAGTPPPAPGQQDRYKNPAHYDGVADVRADDGGYVERSE